MGRDVFTLKCQKPSCGAIMEPDAESSLIETTAWALMQWARLHKQECLNPDCREPYNTLAFIAHVMGIRSTDLDKLRDEMVGYENQHRHPHGVH